MKTSLWDFKARFYRAVRPWFPFSLILETEKRNLAILLQNVPKLHDPVLDVGIGTGHSLDIYPSEWRIIGMDQSRGMIRQLQRVRTNHELVVAKAQTIPLADASIPFLSAIGLVEYLNDPDRFLIEAARVIQPGGWLLTTIAEPNLWTLLRNALGNRIHPHDANTWETMLEKNGFLSAAKTRSFMQVQVLARRVG